LQRSSCYLFFRFLNKITFPGFGTFSVSERAARKGRNLQTGAELQIAASKGGKFTAGKDLKGL
jgi:DNA-binding protein HU-beta